MHGSPDFRTCPSNVLETAHLHNQSHVYKAPEDQMSSKQQNKYEFIVPLKKFMRVPFLINCARDHPYITSAKGLGREWPVSLSFSTIFILT